MSDLASLVLGVDIKDNRERKRGLNTSYNARIKFRIGDLGKGETLGSGLPHMDHYVGQKPSKRVELLPRIYSVSNTSPTSYFVPWPRVPRGSH